MKASVESVLGGGARPCLVWCFIEVDRHVHLHGYDAHVAHVLRSIEEAAVAWARRGATVLAHSDHGLVPTRNDARLERLFDRLQAQRGCRIGGAGRTRWIYPPDDDASLAVELARDLAPSVRVAPARQFFVPGSLAERRVGSLMLIAQGEDFVVPPGYCFDHGSLLPAETNVFDAEWRP